MWWEFAIFLLNGGFPKKARNIFALFHLFGKFPKPKYSLMASSHLSTALKYWLHNGHSQKEFVKATGIDVGTVSLIFRGLRGLTLKQRANVYFAFRDRPDLHDALGWLVADLRDNVPPELAEYIQVHLSDTARIREAHPLSPKEAAKARFIAALEADDPSTVDLVLSLDAFSQVQKTPSSKPKR